MEMGRSHETNAEVPQFKAIFKSSLINIAPKAVSTMSAIIDINKELILPTYYWTMPDGFKVKCDIKIDKKLEPFEYDLGEFKISLPASTKEVYTADYESRALAPNIIHSIDGYIARQMVRKMNGKFITTIHDAFACHPRDCDLMRKNYNEIMVEILESNLLNDITTQILGTQTNHVKTNDLTAEMVLASELSLS
jgi:DNA-directed RNA polymerase